MVENGLPAGQLQPLRRGAGLLDGSSPAQAGRRMLVDGGDQVWHREGVEVVGLQAGVARAGA